MKVSATKLANDSKAIPDKVIQRGDKTIARIWPRTGPAREEIVEILD